MGKILCIGEALIDMICTDKGMPLSAGNNFLKKAGGAPANVAAAIAALGGQVSLCAKVGIDPFGQHLVDLIHSFGVDTTQLLQSRESFTTFAFVSLMENGERDFYFNRGADALLTEAEIDAIDVSKYNIVHFGSATAFLDGPLKAAYTTLLDKAIKSKIYISFDPNYRQLLFGHQQESFIAQSWVYLENCNFFKVSDEEALLLTGASRLEDAVTIFNKKLTATFAITLGSEGTLLSSAGNTITVPSIPIKPTDTTGAGDAFVGAVLYQLSEKANQLSIDTISINEWLQIIKNANKAGARTCEYMGAMEAFRHLSKSIFE